MVRSPISGAAISITFLFFIYNEFLLTRITAILESIKLINLKLPSGNDSSLSSITRTL